MFFIITIYRCITVSIAENKDPEKNSDRVVPLVPITLNKDVDNIVKVSFLCK